MKLLKHIFFILFFCVFLLELLQNVFPIFHFSSLNGVIAGEPKPNLTIDNWISGQYQEHQMRYFEQELDIRPTLIRFRNQLRYSVFNEASNSNVTIGKDNVLYGTGYIYPYLGKDFIGENKIKEVADKLLYVQQELKKRNIDLVFVIAPGKPSVFPEYLPSKYNLSEKKRTNYDAFSEQLKKQNINHIDFTNYFLKLKPKSKYPLFANSGMHWSGYGANIAADTLMKYMENLRGIDMIDYCSAGGIESTTPCYTDADVAQNMNLIVDIPSEKMYYPAILFKKDTKKTKPNVLIIGDSFTWTWIEFYPYFPNLFDEKSAFWYYNHHVGWGPADKMEKLTENLNLKDETLHRDFILIVNTESNLNPPGQLFIDKMYEMLHVDIITVKN